MRTMTQTRGVFRNPRTLCKVFSAAQNSCAFLNYPVQSIEDLWALQAYSIGVTNPAAMRSSMCSSTVVQRIMLPL